MDFQDEFPCQWLPGLPRSASTRSELGAALSRPASRAASISVPTPAAQRRIQDLTTLKDIKDWIAARPKTESDMAAPFLAPLCYAYRRGDRIAWNWQVVLLKQTSASPDMVLAMEKASKPRNDGELGQDQITRYLESLTPQQRSAAIPHFNAMWQADMNGNMQAKQAAENALMNDRNMGEKNARSFFQRVKLGCPVGMLGSRVWMQKWFAARPPPEKQAVMPYYGRMVNAYGSNKAAWDAAIAEMKKHKMLSEDMIYVATQLADKSEVEAWSETILVDERCAWRFELHRAVDWCLVRAGVFGNRNHRSAVRFPSAS